MGWICGILIDTQLNGIYSQQMHRHPRCQCCFSSLVFLFVKGV